MSGLELVVVCIFLTWGPWINSQHFMGHEIGVPDTPPRIKRTSYVSRLVYLWLKRMENGGRLRAGRRYTMKWELVGCKVFKSKVCTWMLNHPTFFMRIHGDR